MKEEFYGFYEPTKEQIDETWTNGIVVFDANALLNLYRYTSDTREDLLKAIVYFKDRLFMPYQVGHEYHNNRISVINGVNSAYQELLDEETKASDTKLKTVINDYTRHPSIGVEALHKVREDFIKNLKTELDKQKAAHPDFLKKDPIREQLTELYTKKVGKPFSKEELKKIYVEGKERFEQKVPPGYRDGEAKKDKGEQSMYGDFIIWKELTTLISKEKKSIMFITDDRKDDWWTIEKGKVIRPREELVKEFFEKTGIRILIYSADNFLSHVKERKLLETIKDKSIKEVEEVRLTDEDQFATLNLIRNNSYIDPTDRFLKVGDKIYDITSDGFVGSGRNIPGIYGPVSDAIYTTHGLVPNIYGSLYPHVLASGHIITTDQLHSGHRIVTMPSGSLDLWKANYYEKGSEPTDPPKGEGNGSEKEDEPAK
jgi:hypothetical protein